MDQRVDPPSWLPDGAMPGTETSTDSDTDSPVSDDAAEQDEVVAESPYSFAGPTSYSNGQDTAFGQDDVSGAAFDHQETSAGSFGSQDVAGGAFGHQDTSAGPFGQQDLSGAAYSHEDTGLADSGLSAGTAAVPPYPAQLTADMAADAGAAAPSAAPAPPRRRPAVFSGVKRTKAASGAASARRAELVVARFEPWSVMKFSFLISIVAWVMLFVAVAVLYFALSTLGVFDSVQKTLESVTSSQTTSGVNLGKWFSASRILGYTMLIGAANIILITALSTVGAMIYNLVTHLGGGIEVTLRETD